MTVKFNVRDYPRRGDATKENVVVDAKDQDEAVQLAEIEAAHRWPTGKWKWFDCIVDREALHAATTFAASEGAVGLANSALMQADAPLKRARGRPRKVA